MANQYLYLSGAMTKKRLKSMLDKLIERNRATKAVELILTYDVLLSTKEFKTYQTKLQAVGQII